MKGINSRVNTVKLTQREFIIIAVFLVLLECYLIYTYFLESKYNEFKEMKRVFEIVESQKNDLEQEYAQKDKYEDEIGLLNYKIERIEEEIPPYAEQEEVILSLTELSKKNDVTISNISFSNIVQTPVDQYMSNNQQANKKDNEARTPGSSSSVITEQLVNISAQGNYDNIYSFLNDIEKNARRIYVRNMSMSANAGESIVSNMVLSYVSLSDKHSITKYNLDMPENNGKDNLFQSYYMDNSEGTNTGNANDNISESQSGSEITDVTDDDDASGDEDAMRDPNFYLYINGYLDSAMKVIFGEYPYVKTEVYSNINDTVNGKIVLNDMDEKIEYELSLDENSYSGTKDIEPINDTLILKVRSMQRMDEEDKVSINFDVENNTKYTLKIISYDDTDNPRFMLQKTVGEVVMDIQ